MTREDALRALDDVKDLLLELRGREITLLSQIKDLKEENVRLKRQLARDARQAR